MKLNITHYSRDRRPSHPPRHRYTLLLVLLLLSTPSLAQPKAEDTCQVKEVILPLNSTGFGDSKFLNPRNPYNPVIAPAQATAERFKECLGKATVTFSNETADRTFIVSLPFEIKTEGAFVRTLKRSLEELQLTLVAVGEQQYAKQLGQEIAAVDEKRRKEEKEEKEKKEGSRPDLGWYIEKTRKVYEDSKKLADDQLVASRRESLYPLIEEAKNIRDSLQLLVNPDRQCGKPSASGIRSCSSQVLVTSGSQISLKAKEWRPIYTSADGLIELKVSFFDEAETPSNDTAYIRAAPGSVPEPPSKTTWSVVSSATYSRDPELDPDPEHSEVELFSSDHPYTGNMLGRIVGVGRLDVEQTLGYRAKAKVQLSYKAGDFGEVDQSREVEAKQYSVDIYDHVGFNLRFGRFDMAAPSESIAVKESGEGVEVVIPGSAGISVGYLAKRESLTGVANGRNRSPAH